LRSYGKTKNYRIASDIAVMYNSSSALFDISDGKSRGVRPVKAGAGAVGQDASVEEFETGAAMHLAFDYLRPVNLAFYPDRVPVPVDSNDDGRNLF